MTIKNDVVWVGVDGANQTEIPFNFRIYPNNIDYKVASRNNYSISVYKKSSADAELLLLAEGTDYTVVKAANEGGTIHLLTPLAVGATMVLVSSLLFQQNVEFPLNSPVNPASNELADDRQGTLILQLLHRYYTTIHSEYPPIKNISVRYKTTDIENGKLIAWLADPTTPGVAYIVSSGLTIDEFKAVLQKIIDDFKNDTVATLDLIRRLVADAQAALNSVTTSVENISKLYLEILEIKEDVEDALVEIEKLFDNISLRLEQEFAEIKAELVELLKLATLAKKSAAESAAEAGKLFTAIEELSVQLQTLAGTVRADADKVAADKLAVQKLFLLFPDISTGLAGQTFVLDSAGKFGFTTPTVVRNLQTAKLGTVVTVAIDPDGTRYLEANPITVLSTESVQTVAPAEESGVNARHALTSITSRLLLLEGDKNPYPWGVDKVVADLAVTVEGNLIDFIKAELIRTTSPPPRDVVLSSIGNSKHYTTAESYTIPRVLGGVEIYNPSFTVSLLFFTAPTSSEIVLATKSGFIIKWTSSNSISVEVGAAAVTLALDPSTWYLVSVVLDTTTLTVYGMKDVNNLIVTTESAGTGVAVTNDPVSIAGTHDVRIGRIAFLKIAANKDDLESYARSLFLAKLSTGATLVPDPSSGTDGSVPSVSNGRYVLQKALGVVVNIPNGYTFNNIVDATASIASTGEYTPILKVNSVTKTIEVTFVAQESTQSTMGSLQTLSHTTPYLLSPVNKNRMELNMQNRLGTPIWYASDAASLTGSTKAAMFIDDGVFIRITHNDDIYVLADGDTDINVTGNFSLATEEIVYVTI